MTQEDTKRTYGRPATFSAIFSNSLRFCRRVVDHFTESDCLSMAAALTYTTLLALVPLMTVVYFFASFLPGYAEVGLQIHRFVYENFLPESSVSLYAQLQAFAERARGLSGVGALTLMLTAGLMLLAVERQLNLIWRVEMPAWSGRRILVYWGILSLAPTILISTLLLGAHLLSLPLLAPIDVLQRSELIVASAPLVLGAIGFTVLFAIVPNTPGSLRSALWAGALTAITLQLALMIFTFVSREFLHNAIYGAFAALPTFLLWLYVAWSIVLGGAVVARVLSEHDGNYGARNEALAAALYILRALYAAHQKGESLGHSEVLEHCDASREAFIRVETTLRSMRLVKLDSDGQWLLGRELAGVRLLDLYDAFLPSDLGWTSTDLEEFGLAEQFDQLRANRLQILSLTLQEVVR